MRFGTGMILALGVMSTATSVGIVAFMCQPLKPTRDALLSDDVFKIREEAFTWFPRGSRVEDATAELMRIGFRCSATPHRMANINAESVACDSHGRGYPAFSAVNLAVLARNGLLSEIVVWTLNDRADAETSMAPRAVQQVEPLGSSRPPKSRNDPVPAGKELPRGP